MMDNEIVFDAELIKKYDRSGPRYTSYPTAVQFGGDFGEDQYREHAGRSNQSGRPLSIYVHIPFCDTVCFYCACNKVITKNRRRASDYLARLYREIALQGELFDSTRTVRQLHWGGGTPTFIHADEMRELMTVTARHFSLQADDSGEYSIEIDPRETDSGTIALLRDLGFNRLSMGVQDFDPAVQVAVNRIQPLELTVATIEAARQVGFRSIGVDLIYGLPLQTEDSFAVTLDKVIELAPDRLSVFNYAHLPHMFKTQRQIDTAQLPTAAAKLQLLRLVVEKLGAAGYEYIGMDHFARPTDELAIAQREGTLYRNFQGYSTHSGCDLVALGATSIGMIGSSYSQNLRALPDYMERIDAGHLPVFRGVELDDDDRLRRDVITQLICNLSLQISQIESQHRIDFAAYFEHELEDLAGFEEDGLIEYVGDDIRVHPPGRLLIRNICMVFDRYLRDNSQKSFSRVI
jgi:oxygen-independent coproporphyrinogen-3 oxidase